MRLTIKEMSQMSSEALDAKFQELSKELVKLNAQVATGTTPKSPGMVKRIKKDIARIKTYTSMEKKHE